jgi:hypothetical protein
LSEIALKAKRAKAKRRLDSAIAGGVFLSRADLCERWGCVMATALTRIKKGGIREYVFPGGQSVRYRLDDILEYENKALAQGFLKRAEQLTREGSK